jgi:hypothetical protein
MRWMTQSWLVGLVMIALVPSGANWRRLGAGRYGTCDAGCEAPEPGPLYTMGAAYGAGIGALAGWVIDKLHKGRKKVLPVVSPVLTTRHKGVAVSVRF